MVIYGGNIKCLANTRLLVLANKLSSYLSIGFERAADYTVSVYTRFTYTYNTTCWVIPSTLPNMEVKSKTTVCGGSGHLLRSVSYKLSTLFDLFQSGVHSFSWALKKRSRIVWQRRYKQILWWCYKGLLLRYTLGIWPRKGRFCL